MNRSTTATDRLKGLVASFASRIHWARLSTRMAIGDLLLALVLVGGVVVFARTGSTHESAVAAERGSAETVNLIKALRFAAKDVVIESTILIEDSENGRASTEKRQKTKETLAQMQGLFDAIQRDPAVASHPNINDARVAVDRLATAVTAALDPALRRADDARLNAVRHNLLDAGDAPTEALVKIEEPLIDRSSALRATLTGEVDTLLWTSYAMLAVALIVLGTRQYMIQSLIVAPANRLAKATRRLADGDFDADVPMAKIEELKAIGEALDVLRETARDADKLRAEARGAEEEALAARARLAEADLAARTREDEVRAQARADLASEFEQSVAGIVNAVQTASIGLSSAAIQLATAARAATGEAETIATASGKASDNVSSVAAATEELTMSIREIAIQVTNQSNLASAASDKSETGSHAVQELVRRADDIRSIVGLVQNVAGQTDLLALNAAIESARAGAAGSGFAVVANEVKQLAAQTADSAGQIDEMVSSIRETVDGTSHSMGEVTKALGGVKEIALAVASAMSQQNMVAEEIARHAATAAGVSGDISHSITGLASAVRQADELAGLVEKMSSELSGQAEVLKSATGQFVTVLRNAA